MTDDKLKRIIAERSLEWRSSDKVSFLWGSELVIAYVNSDYRHLYFLTDLTAEDHQDISGWLGKHLQKLDEELEDNRIETNRN